MQTHTFEIKIALLGHVSAGKSTVLNALLRDKFSEVSMRRTTAGVNYFRLHEKESLSLSPSTDDDSAKDGDIKSHVAENEKTDVTVAEEIWKLEPETVHDAASTLQTITRDNAILRKLNQIQESTFDIKLDEPLCDMRKDTKLVLIDIPGLNEAGSKDIFRTYVNDKWDTFDCVIVVMDVTQGVNTEEQVDLLRLVQHNTATKKDVPIIVLCNKVDDPDNQEVQLLVDEVRSKVNEIFASSLSVAETKGSAVHAPTPPKMANLTATAATSPIVCPALEFIPVSAENAFVYRTVSKLDLDGFKKLDKDLVERLGRDEVGKSKWRRLSPDEKYLAAYEVILHNSYDDSFDDTNFDQFLKSLQRCIGGDAVQLALLDKQLVVRLKSLNFDTVIATELMQLSVRHNVLSRQPMPYDSYFWDAYARSLKPCTAAFKSDMDNGRLQVAMSQLVAYAAFVEQPNGSSVERHKIVQQMMSLVTLQIGLVLKNAAEQRESPTVYRELFDWDRNLKCWINLTTCDDCSRGFECRRQGHVWNLHDCPPGFHLSSRNGGTIPIWSHCDQNGRTNRDCRRYGVDIQNPPNSESPRHHWVWSPYRSQWVNLYTGKACSSIHNPATGKLTWAALTPRDSCTISESILLLSYSKIFCAYFGREKAELDRTVCHYNAFVQSLNEQWKQTNENHQTKSVSLKRAYTLFVKALQGSYNDNGEFVPDFPDQYKEVAQIEMPRRLMDPNHWGYLAFMFCEFMESHSDWAA